MDHERALKGLARAGYLARALVYVIIGYFAFQAAIGSGSTTDTEGAVTKIMAQPFGTAMVAVLVVGLVGYAGWRMAQGVFDADGRGTGAKGLAVRAGYVVSGLVHLALAGFALGLVLGWGSGGGGGDPTGEWLVRFLPDGSMHILTLAAAAIAAIVGIAHFVKAWKASFERHLRADLQTLDRVRPICRAGIAARGVVFILIAVLLYYAGTIYDPADAPGLEDALTYLQTLPYGWVLLAAMGLGLIAYAVYNVVQAMYRRVEMR